MATIQIQIDDDIKTTADSLFKSYGLDTESALQVFIATVIKQKGMPFFFEACGQPDKVSNDEEKQRRLAFMGCMNGEVWER